jgi:holin-like protein
MPVALAILIGLQLIGEVLRQSLHLPLPGPLIGMFLLVVILVIRGSAGDDGDHAVPPTLGQAANVLIANMGLLFVPAGVGVIAELGVLRQAWLAILAGLVVSTVLGLAVTGLVMHHVSRVRQRPVPAPAE